MLRLKVTSILVQSSVALLLVFSTPLSTEAFDHFSVREYNEFHNVLHPLEHEALPAKDFQRIRQDAKTLVQRGKAMVKRGIPIGTDQKYVDEFRKELRKFNKSLDKFSKDAKAGTDSSLEASFSAVHDSFEMLVGMLPRK